MLNRRVDSQASSQAVGEGNPRDGVVACRKPTGSAGMLVYLRQAAFRRNVLRQSPLNSRSLGTIVFIHFAIDQLKTLYISVPQVMKYSAYSPTGMGRGTVSTAVNDLCAQGLMMRTTRKALRGTGTQVLYGMTASGKALVGEFLSYLAGEHDDKLPL